LPGRALRRDAGAALLAHPLGREALLLASPSLSAARPGRDRARGQERAIDRYGRRAAFRATPHGLLAGVCVGTLGPSTGIATGGVAAPIAHRAPRWADVDRLARELLDQPEVRARARVRVTASALRGASRVTWIGPGEPFGVEHSAIIDAGLAAILDAADRWTPWPAACEAVRRALDDVENLDDLLLLLLDDGLLEHDLAPPLVGPAPAEHVSERLTAMGLSVRDLPAEVVAAHATLLHAPRSVPTLQRAAVRRAAALVPLLARLQDALFPPAAERFSQPALADGLDAITELFGAGAFSLGALAAGDYGVDFGDADADASSARAPATGPLAIVVEAIVRAARDGAAEAALDERTLAAALADESAIDSPPTAELFLSPMTRPARGGKRPPPGTGWLLGLHAPAGASLGRFAHALGPPLAEALDELAAAERRIRPDQETVDVSFAPAPALADVAATPRARRRTLAVTRFTGADDDLALRDLELVADPADPAGLALREAGAAGAGSLVAPSPLARVRSATAPAGLARLVVGWSLQRQHAPWALPVAALSALAPLDFIPRLTLGGFVVAPASWRVPDAVGAGRAAAAAVARWRRDARLPRFVQVGDGDELLPVDLAAAHAAADLAGHARVHEIWPPLEANVDRDGRRVEAVVMVVDEPDEGGAITRREAAARAMRAGTVPAPAADTVASAQLAAGTGWRSFKLFGSAADQDDLLRDDVVPAVAAARAAGELDAWFFLRYVDGPGSRHHVRLRVRATGDWTVFARRLETALLRARTDGTLAGLELAEYRPERGRFVGEAELDAAHAIFEADSARAAAALDTEAQDDRVIALVCAHDALAAGLGLGLDARHVLARALRASIDGSGPRDPRDPRDPDDRAHADATFRRLARPLGAALQAAPPADPNQDALLARARAALTDEARERLLPTFLHLSAVRFLGPDRAGERLAVILWERALEGLRKRRRG
jgi:thiopeptide-type bacteriocin biosynthesis protein